MSHRVIAVGLRALAASEPARSRLSWAAAAGRADSFGAEPQVAHGPGIEQPTTIDDDRVRHPDAGGEAQSRSRNSGHSVAITAASAPDIPASRALSWMTSPGSSRAAREAAAGSYAWARPLRAASSQGARKSAGE